ncbi:substrate-binding domain-containing protein [Streptomyces sp. NPDC056821]|uniref:substrate-binding domain-containing protein n=1 Tax=unclassified Streptomyces TaxID=2593676 RepID=UPI0036AC31BF
MSRDNPRSHNPQESPVKAFTWALAGLRAERNITLAKMSLNLPYDRGGLSRVTEGKDLPGQEQMEMYVRGCGAETAPWVDLLAFARSAASAGAGREDLEAFAEALVERCARDLPAHSAELGSASSLVAAWADGAGPAAQDSGSGVRTPAGAGGSPGPEEKAGARPGPPHPPRQGTRRTAVAIGIVITLIVAGAGAYAAFGDSAPKEPSGSPSRLAACPHPAQTLTVASSTDKSAIITELADGYGARSSHGQCVKVAVNSIDSGTAMQALADGWNTRTNGPRPDVWSPASQTWLQIARQRAAGKDTLGLLPHSAGPSIVTSPLTIAMPEPTARKLGWPDKKLSWKDLADLARMPGYKLGKTNPEYSTSGLNATIAAFYTQTGTTGELSPADLTDKTNQEKVRAIEKAAVHYGDTTLTFLANLRRYETPGRPPPTSTRSPWRRTASSPTTRATPAAAAPARPAARNGNRPTPSSSPSTRPTTQASARSTPTTPTPC